MALAADIADMACALKAETEARAESGRQDRESVLAEAATSTMVEVVGSVLLNGFSAPRITLRRALRHALYSARHAAFLLERGETAQSSTAVTFPPGKAAM